MKTVFKGAMVYSSCSRSFIKADICTENGIITDVAAEEAALSPDTEVIDCAGKYIIPGLVDIHTHGRGGFDFNTVKESEMAEVRASYAAAGTTTVMATLASATLDSLHESMEIIGKNRTPVPGIASIAGTHLEGRYLSVKRRGAHAESLLAPLDADELADLIGRMSPLPVHVSAAVEQDGGEAFVKRAVSLGATVGMVHSDATYAEAMEAVQWGITSFTHTFNAMRPIHHREPGNMIASLMCDSAYTELICDGEHVHPAMIALAHRTKPTDKLILITDSMEAAGCSDGTYAIAGLKVFVKDGRAINEDGALAGSTLNLFAAMKNFMSFTGITLEEAIPCATSNPAAMVGIDSICGELRKGLRADLLILNDRTDPEIEAVYAFGAKVER
ncbi:MAG: N-acetylglucosamine-6-phosphate deacetylase [Ruminococcaceae bacterium]|nr:N-acetylglucosamine-6-phosphate deacetylase [Oscillospiraceae bacterium]